MKYNLKEYECIFDSPIKKPQEMAIARKIIEALNKNNYNNFEDFTNKNKDYNDFLKNNRMENVIKHFGNTLKQEDYNLILNNFKKMIDSKMKIDENMIKTTNINNKEIVSLEGQNVYLNNSLSDKSIVDQMKQIQGTGEQFQTTNKEKNTERLFDELANTKKENLNFQNIDDVNYNELTDEEKKLYHVSKAQQENTGEQIKVNFSNNLIADDDNDISSIERRGNDYIISSEDNEVEKSEVTENMVNNILKKEEKEEKDLVKDLFDLDYNDDSQITNEISEENNTNIEENIESKENEENIENNEVEENIEENVDNKIYDETVNPEIDTIVNSIEEETITETQEKSMQKVLTLNNNGGFYA